MRQDLVSIITPVYNAERFINKTIESIHQQTYQNWELLLIDDCSQDHSVKLIKEWCKKDERICLVQLEQNSGAAVARNKGLELANGQYIAFIDSDDCWNNAKLANQLSFMKENNYSFTYTNFALIDEAGNILKNEVNIPNSLDYYGLLKNTSIACSTVMIDRTIIGDFQMPLVRKGQDTATWLKLMRERQVTAYGLNQVLNYYRQVKGSISSNKFSALQRTWHTYYCLEKLSLPKAIYYFGHYVWNATMRRI